MENAQAISTAEVSKAIRPYSQRILAGQFLFVPGQLPINPTKGKMIDTDIAERAKQVFRNISAIIDSADGSIAVVVKITLFLTDMCNFQHVNEVYSQHFKSPYPARSATQVSDLPLGSNIEAEDIVYIP